MRRVIVLAAVVAAAGQGYAAGPSAEGPHAGARTDGIVVASFDFAETRLLAEIRASSQNELVVTARTAERGSVSRRSPTWGSPVRCDIAP